MIIILFLNENNFQLDYRNFPFLSRKIPGWKNSRLFPSISIRFLTSDSGVQKPASGTRKIISQSLNPENNPSTVKNNPSIVSRLLEIHIIYRIT
jgi:hypothetical protein